MDQSDIFRELEDVEGAGGEEEAGSEDLGDDDDLLSEEEDLGVTTKPYLALLQSFQESAGHKSKKRKLRHSKEEQSARKTAKNEAEDARPLVQEKTGEAGDPDQVEEAEEAVDEDEPDHIQEQESDDEEDPADPFDAHLGQAEEDNARIVKGIQTDGWETRRIESSVAKMMLTAPKTSFDKLKHLPAPVSGPDGLKLKQRLREGALQKMAEFDQTQRHIAPIMFNYQDILFCERNLGNADSLRKLTCLHALNHIFKYAFPIPDTPQLTVQNP